MAGEDDTFDLSGSGDGSGSWDLSGGAPSGGAPTDWKGIANALSGFGQGTQQQQGVPQMAPAQVGQSPVGQATSGAVQGSPAGMNALTQMLMAKVLALRDASNPQTAKPINLQAATSRATGLLGL